MGWEVREGMMVRTADGERLGTVVQRGEDTFVIEKGLLLPRDFIARYDEVAEVRGDEVRLRRTRDEMIPAPWRKARGEEVVRLGTFGEPQELAIELAHEEAEPRTVLREVGQLRIRKVVRTEVKHFSIPVRREELVVERLPVSDDAHAQERASVPGGPAMGAPFEEATFVIPLREERVEFSKSTHVWQEVRVSKAAQEELRSVRTTVRRETAEVEERGEVLHEGPVDGLHS